MPVVKLPWSRSKRLAAPTDLELELVDALEAVTECADEAGGCAEDVRHGHDVLLQAKQELGLTERPRRPA